MSGFQDLVEGELLISEVTICRGFQDLVEGGHYWSC